MNPIQQAALAIHEDASSTLGRPLPSGAVSSSSRKSITKRQTRTAEVAPAIRTDREADWFTARVFNSCYRAVHGLYQRIRLGTADVVVHCVSLCCLLLGLGLFIYLLVELADLVILIFSSAAIGALVIYIATVVAHIVSELTRLPWAERLEKYDTVAFTAYVVLSCLILLMEANDMLYYHAIILALTFFGGHVYSIFLLLSALITILWVPCASVELIVRILLCRPCLEGGSKCKIVYTVYGYERANAETKECIICFYEYTEGEEVCELRCHKSHVFHEACFLEWAKKQAICPVCRAPLAS